ncbi:hypothetical protein [Paenibacillus sp. 32352]|uniref:hypothetical protein n=1 Tax=Paenibacillus sp. 32352 TaxID=1969111 RepID=UPI0009AD489C|nr:hypothetical protein [Paenibacillus sp. 32352]
MKKRLSFSLLLLVFVFTTLFSSISYAATIGQSVLNPESGWQRFDDTHSSIKYTGSWITATTDPSTYKVTMAVGNTPGNSFKFLFKGTKVRLLATMKDSRSSHIKVSVDGAVDYFSEYSPTVVHLGLVYEKTQLPDGVHTVEVQLTDTNGLYLMLDAVDIDASGYLIGVDGNKLTAASSDSTVNLNWTSVVGATYYTVSRALTPNGPYSVIGSTDSLEFSDKNVTNGTTYYYIVTAKSSSGLYYSSNEASATPSLSNQQSGRAILKLIMTNGVEKEYDLSMSEVQAFMDWYDAKETGTGSARYKFSNAASMGPFKARTEYVIFDKILMFNVDEYDTVQ